MADVYEQKLNEVLERLERIEAAVAGEPVPTGATAEQVRQASICGDIFDNMPAEQQERVLRDNAGRFPIALRHPDLVLVPESMMGIRSAGWAATIMGIPDEDQVMWHGNLIRADGGLGMYATPKQAAEWPNKAVEDSVLGPSR